MDNLVRTNDELRSCSAIRAAAKEGHQNVVTYLLNATDEEPNSDGRLLRWAATMGRLDLVKALVAMGGSPFIDGPSIHTGGGEDDKLKSAFYVHRFFHGLVSFAISQHQGY